MVTSVVFPGGRTAGVRELIEGWAAAMADQQLTTRKLAAKAEKRCMAGVSFNGRRNCGVLIVNDGEAIVNEMNPSSLGNLI